MRPCATRSCHRASTPPRSSYVRLPLAAPVLMAANVPNGERVQELLADDATLEDAAVEEVIAIVREGGYVDASLDAARQRLDTAAAALARLPDGEPRRILETLGGYLVDRVDAVRA